MASCVEIERLGALVRAKREMPTEDHPKGLDLRRAAKIIGDISPSTLSRVERGVGSLHLSTFLQLCDWLEVSPHELIKADRQQSPAPLSDLERIEGLLRATDELDPTMAKALADLIRSAARLDPH